MYSDNEEDNPFLSQQQEAQKAAEIAQHELRLRHDRFMEELSKDQLGTFSEMLHIIIANEGYAHFLVGCSTTIMRLKHDSCACGKDHNAANSQILDQTRAEMNIPTQADRSTTPPVTVALAVDEGLMKEYMLAPNDHGTLSCTGCGMDYQSLDDRMLRNPGMDGCSGCQYKSGHG